MKIKEVSIWYDHKNEYRLIFIFFELSYSNIEYRFYFMKDKNCKSAIVKISYEKHYTYGIPIDNVFIKIVSYSSKYAR